MTGTMVEDGVIEEYATPMPEVTPQVDEHEALCQRLGLGTMTQRGRLTVVTSNRTATAALRHYPEWRGRKLKAWRKFMPYRYLERHWAMYRFDVPPVRALKAIEAARATGIFERLEIWTPEGRQLRRSPMQYLIDEYDPVCVGIVQGRVFPIVRWGAEELVSERRVRLTGLFLRSPEPIPSIDL